MSTETRDALLRRATEMVDREGPDAVTLRSLGDAVGLSRQAPYRHFHDKTALLAAIAAASFAELEVHLSRALRASDETGADALEAVVSAFIDWASQHPSRYALMIRPALRSDASLVRNAQAAHARFADALLRRPGGQADATTTAAVFALAHGVVDLANSGVFRIKGLDPKRIAKRLIAHEGRHRTIE